MDNQTNETINAFATGLQSSLFATRDTVEEAYKYAADIINTLPVDQQFAVHTAMQVVINTIAEQVKNITMLGGNDGQPATQHDTKAAS